MVILIILVTISEHFVKTHIYILLHRHTYIFSNGFYGFIRFIDGYRKVAQLYGFAGLWGAS